MYRGLLENTLPVAVADLPLTALALAIAAIARSAEQPATVSLHDVNQMEAPRVSFQAGSQVVNIIYSNLVLVLRRFKSQWLPCVPSAFGIKELL